MSKSITIESIHNPKHLEKMLLESKMFRSSKSTSYGSQLQYRTALNELFIGLDSSGKIIISENAGHGGFSEVMAFIDIKPTNFGSNIFIQFKMGGFHIDWFKNLLNTLTFLSSILILLNSKYFLIITFFFAAMSMLSEKSNKKIVSRINQAVINIIKDSPKKKSKISL